MSIHHPRCTQGRKCLIPVNGSGAHLSPLTGKYLCIPCYIARWGRAPWGDK